jgi:pimeloyl-ACP methyl ester carboxylesterase
MVALILAIAFAEPVETRFEQVQPPATAPALRRSKDERTAVALIHGLRIHPIRREKIHEAAFHEWQQAGSMLVSKLGEEADVFSFAYGQDVPVSEIAESAGLRDAITQVKKAGYSEVVLVGHSAGGLIARQFVEDRPASGVTKVIQVCSPNDGASLANWKAMVPKEQEPFVLSFSKQARAQWLLDRKGKSIPKHVQFVCVMGDGGGVGDFVVSDDSQWPTDLQDQGIPVIRLATTHLTVMRSSSAADYLSALVVEPIPRWSKTRVEAARKEVFGASLTQSGPSSVSKTTPVQPTKDWAATGQAR